MARVTAKVGKGCFPVLGSYFSSRRALTTHLITHMQREEEHQHSCGRVSSVMLCPPVMDVLEEGWVVNLDL